MNVKRWPGLFFRALISITLIILLFWFIEIGNGLHLVFKAHPGWIAASIIILLLRIPVMAERWRIILATIGVNFGRMAINIILVRSLLYGMFLPSNSGNDLVRILLLKDSRLSLMEVAASVVVDRLFGIASIAAITLGTIAFFNLDAMSGNVLNSAIMLAVAIIVFSLALPGATWFATRWFSARPVKREGRLGHWLANSASALKLLHNSVSRPKIVFQCFTLSVITQLAGIASGIFIGLAIGFDVPLWSYFLFVPIVWIISMVPVSISGIGVREAGFAVLFASVGASVEQGAIFGLLMTLVTLFHVLAGSIVLIFRPMELPAFWKKGDR